jgi:hypothetical protein
MTGLIDVAATALCDVEKQLVERVDQANSVGVGMIRAQRG